MNVWDSRIQENKNKIILLHGIENTWIPALEINIKSDAMFSNRIFDYFFNQERRILAVSSESREF